MEAARLPGDKPMTERMRLAMEKKKLFENVPAVIEHRVKGPNGDVERVIRYTRGRFLGKGGFAYCYEVTDGEGNVSALKVVPRESIKKTRARQKLVMEIRIHRTLDHPNIVKFKTFFEDKNYVYILLEMCSNKSMMRLVRKRRRISEAEARYYLFQIVQGLIYLKEQKVVHRDMKLGNLFINEEMVLKIGDFGLATRLDHDGDRKKTICGTPNYLAPEMLSGDDYGHSYEVDVWSVGVIMYIFLVGRPPFESKDLRTTYKSIKACSYSFPPGIKISESARSLVTSILKVDPAERPSLEAIRGHDFFSNYCVPLNMPKSAMCQTPTPREKLVPFNGAMSSPSHYWATTPEKSKFPMITSPKPTPASPPPAQSTFRSPNRLQSPNGGWKKGMRTPKKKVLDGHGPKSPSRQSTTDDGRRRTRAYMQEEPPIDGENDTVHLKEVQRAFNAITLCTRTDLREETRKPSPVRRSARRKLDDSFDETTTTTTKADSGASSGQKENAYNETPPKRDKRRKAEVEELKSGLSKVQLSHQNSYIEVWVDRSAKYGMAYLLHDKTTGVYFPDNTVMCMSAEGVLMYWSDCYSNDAIRFCASNTPASLVKKGNLLLYFRGYFKGQEKPATLTDLCENDAEGMTQLAEKYGFYGSPQRFDGRDVVIVRSWKRRSDGIIFEMSNGNYQADFTKDRSKVVVWKHSKRVVFISGPPARRKVMVSLDELQNRPDITMISDKEKLRQKRLDRLRRKLEITLKMVKTL